MSAVTYDPVRHEPSIAHVRTDVAKAADVWSRAVFGTEEEREEALRDLPKLVPELLMELVGLREALRQIQAKKVLEAMRGKNEETIPWYPPYPTSPLYPTSPFNGGNGGSGTSTGPNWNQHVTTGTTGLIHGSGTVGVETLLTSDTIQ